ncbi:MAG: urease subunit beta [Nitrospira sp.]|nr:urease subunit beta [Nitrospira sp.]
MPKKSKRAPARAHKAPQKKGSSMAAAIKAELAKPVIPGQLLVASGDVELNAGRSKNDVLVANGGDRPIQVGSHCHFFEANRALIFNREQAFGFRLDIPAGTAVRFEPGEEKKVTLVALAGQRIAHGINALTNGSLDDPQVKTKALAKAAEMGFSGKGGAR